jgi:hypothetical protein
MWTFLTPMRYVFAVSGFVRPDSMSSASHSERPSNEAGRGSRPWRRACRSYEFHAAVYEVLVDSAIPCHSSFATFGGAL